MPTKAELYLNAANAFIQLGNMTSGLEQTNYQAIAQSLIDLATIADAPPIVHKITTFRREGSWVQPLGLRVKRIVDRPDAPLRTAQVLYVVKDIFTVASGSWDVSGAYGGVDQWARDAYLKAGNDPLYIQAGGGDHHLFGMVLGLDGLPVKNQTFQFWSDGFEKLGDKGYSMTVVSAQEPSGWVNFPISKGSVYNTANTQGPWCWCPSGASEVVTGGGLPDGHHVSTFVVWEAMKIT